MSTRCAHTLAQDNVPSTFRQLIKGSTLMDSVPEKLQDAYSIRCTPQILGAVRDMLRFVEQQVSVEWNAATDNPLILLDVNDVSQHDADNKAFSCRHVSRRTDRNGDG